MLKKVGWFAKSLLYTILPLFVHYVMAHFKLAPPVEANEVAIIGIVLCMFFVFEKDRFNNFDKVLVIANVALVFLVIIYLFDFLLLTERLDLSGTGIELLHMQIAGVVLVITLVVVGFLAIFIPDLGVHNNEE